MHIFNSRIILVSYVHICWTGDNLTGEPLLILFGSESGNSEELASIAENQAKSMGMSPELKGMDEIQIGDLSSAKNVLIFCSTWGEGEGAGKGVGFPCVRDSRARASARARARASRRGAARGRGSLTLVRAA